MSYGVALRNGVPFTLGTIAALCVNATTQWNPLSLWPDGILSPGMWISPRDLTSQWQDYLGTTPVSVPGTVADSSNPVGLALDIRAGATVLTDPGNHMLQSTSVDRPLLSARVNQLIYTQDFSHTWGWTNGDIATTNKLAAAANSSPHGVRSIFPAMDNPEFTVRASAAEYGFLHLASGNGISPDDGVGFCATFDLVNGTVIKDGSWGTSAQIEAVGGGVYDCSVVSTRSGSTDAVICYGPTAATNVYLGDGTSGVNVFRAQISYQGTDYQSVPGDGSTYSSTGFPIAQLYDGVDDGMATAAFSAGTLIDGMDCLIAVRGDSAKNVILGPYQGPADLSHYVGNAEAGYNAACYTGVGSPTVWVDNVQLINGWASELYTAVTVGDWHIVEFRGLDLSSWVGLGLGLFGIGYNLFGPRGDILLYPSTASTTDKDAARQWLADYYGVTLP
jgi:hypothetical protein